MLRQILQIGQKFLLFEQLTKTWEVNISRGELNMKLKERERKRERE